MRASKLFKIGSPFSGETAKSLSCKRGLDDKTESAHSPIRRDLETYCAQNNDRWGRAETSVSVTIGRFEHNNKAYEARGHRWTTRIFLKMRQFWRPSLAESLKTVRPWVNVTWIFGRGGKRLCGHVKRWRSPSCPPTILHPILLPTRSTKSLSITHWGREKNVRMSYMSI